MRSFKPCFLLSESMDRRAFAGLMIIEMMLAFGNTFAASFNIIYILKELHLETWAGPVYLLIGFVVSTVVSLWMSWKPHLDPRNAMLAGFVFLIAEYGLMLVVHDGWILSIAVGLMFGLWYPLFWTPFNVLMAQMTEKTDRGVTYGAFFFVWPLASFFAPFLGGLVIAWINYQALFGLGIVIILMNAVLVIAYRKYIPKDQVMKIKLGDLGRRNIIATLGEGGFEGVFWIGVTLVAYEFTQDEVDLGALFSLFGLSAGIMAIILGKVSDRIQNRRLFVAISSIASIPCVIMIALSRNIDEYVLGNGLLEFASFIMPVFIFAILTDKLEERKNDSVLTREFLLDIGRASTLAAYLVLLYLGFTPRQCFWLAVPTLIMAAVAYETKARPASSVAKA